MSGKPYTKRHVLTKIKALGDITEDQKKSIVCALIGHSNIIETCFGYIHCGRCGDQIGDSLAGYYNNPDCVIVGHDCPTCRENASRLTWRDTLLAADPQISTTPAEQEHLGTVAVEQTDA